jgi:ABC-2 type transport system ATP-binding protein
MIAIEARELRKTFPVRRGAPVEAVAGISFAVEAGERLAYIGPNGAGKSTSIKMLTGILHPTSGDAEVLGIVPWKKRRELAARIGTLFGQRSQLWYQLTPRQTFGLLGRIYRIPDDEERRRLARLGELLDATQLFDQPVRGLSLGQRMRCELVASMLHAPEVLFLDEPTDRARPGGEGALPRPDRAHQRGAGHHHPADVARRLRHRAGGPAGDRDQPRTADLRRPRVGDAPRAARHQDAGRALRAAARERRGGGRAAGEAHRAGAKLVVDTGQRPIRSVLDDLLDRYDVVDISVADPPLEEIVSHIYARPVVNPYLAGWRLGFLRTIRSPGDMSVRIGFFAIILVVMTALWTAAVDANGGSLQGYTRTSLLWYVFAAQTAVLGVRPRSVEEIGDEIGSGTVAVQMLRPVSVVGLRMSIDMGEACARLIASFTVGALITWLFVGAPPSLPALGLAAPAVVLGCAANIASCHAFGGIAFWLLDAKASWFFFQKLVFLPGGHADPAGAAARAAGADQLRAAVRDDGLRAGTDRRRPPRSAAAALAAGLAGRAAGDGRSRIRGRRAAAAGDGRMTAVAATLRTGGRQRPRQPQLVLVPGVGLMVANDITWFIFWVLFFHQVGNLRGWDAHDCDRAVLDPADHRRRWRSACAPNKQKIGQLSAGRRARRNADAAGAARSRTCLSNRVDAANTGDLLAGAQWCSCWPATPARSAGRCSCSGWSRARWC